MGHVPVLLQETIEGLKLQSGDVVFDGTAGGGGHGHAIAELIGPHGVYIGVDADTAALERVEKSLADVDTKISLVHDNFRNIKAICQTLNVGQLDVIFLDLGLSSYQLDVGGRGFTFRENEPLLMTFDPDPSGYAFTAYDIVNTWDIENITTILESYGEEQFAGRIAHAVVAAREIRPLKTTHDLVEVIKGAVPVWYAKRKIHPATKTFQALRIAVNDELGALRTVLEDGWGLLAPGGRLGIIHFHSLEGRLVKHFFQDRKQDGTGEILTKKAVGPGRVEVLANPRSRSAQLRIIKKY